MAILGHRSGWHFGGAAAAALVAGLAPTAAAAQSTPSDRIAAIERQIRELQVELK